MPRYKHYDYNQTKLIPINYENQIQPGSFEFTISHLVDNEMDLSVFEHRYKNDETGATAFDPAIMLKIILFAYSRGIVSSRKIAQACEENVLFMALSADTKPHFTTIADFVSTMQDEIIHLFRDVLTVCYSEGLIGKEMFAIDGCKISSHCSKEWSGTMEQLAKKRDKLRKSVSFLVKKHKHIDAGGEREKTRIEREKKAIKSLQDKIKKLDNFIASNEDKRGARNSIVQSNLTDNESAKMMSSHGVIQGYNGVAAVDDKNQVILHAEAVGDGNERDTLLPMIEDVVENMKHADPDGDILKESTVTADSGFNSEATMKEIFENNIDAYIADKQFRKRDPRFDDYDKYKQKTLGKYRKLTGKKFFTSEDFDYNEKTGECICPAGYTMILSMKERVYKKGYGGKLFRAPKEECCSCKIRKKCTRARDGFAKTIVIPDLSRRAKVRKFTDRMIEKFDSLKGRDIYSKRMGAVEPVFANLRANLGLDKFTLRGREKVNVQWILYCMVHNIGKIAKAV